MDTSVTFEKEQCLLHKLHYELASAPVAEFLGLVKINNTIAVCLESAPGAAKVVQITSIVEAHDPTVDYEQSVYEAFYGP